MYTRTKPEPLIDKLKRVAAKRDELIEKAGIDFKKEVNTIVESVHDYIAGYDWKKFVEDVNSDQYRVANGADYYAHRLYCTVYIMYSQNIEFNENVFTDLKQTLLSYFEEIEEYEKCAKVTKLEFDDVSFYAPPYEILIDKK